MRGGMPGLGQGAFLPLYPLVVTKGPQGLRSRQFPQGESKGTALGLVRCQSRGHLPTREASWFAVEAGDSVYLPWLTLTGALQGTPAEQWRWGGRGAGLVSCVSTWLQELQEAASTLPSSCSCPCPLG